MRRRARPNLTLSTTARPKWRAATSPTVEAERYPADDLLPPPPKPDFARNVYELGFLSAKGNHFVAAITADGRELERREVRTIREKDEAIEELRELLDLLDPPQGARPFGLVNV